MHTTIGANAVTFHTLMCAGAKACKKEYFASRAEFGLQNRRQMPKDGPTKLVASVRLRQCKSRTALAGCKTKACIGTEVKTRFRTFAAVLVSLISVGCATPVTPTTAGGSKSDGIVVLAGNYGLWKKGEIQWGEARSSALETCRGWGYTDAKAFNTYQTRCASSAQTPVGCASTEVVVRFQCTN